ncbi:putative sodium/proline symporter [Candidatus Protochlamydia naegleriophila]|uniref:Sodium/proline symporter n=1 Tax=Candidatus Protochlamydia naegleriophila TaxID=389348 RepID=A0A0U5K365_9BACT|nr:sodium/proline symporter [Candidatus Protochlamydia naegleriophila]CUI16539.1 putative sodium/proline symporter [Candidatus Protochlamydia naegleriophila]
MHTQVIAAFIVYFSLLLILGLIFHTKQKTSSDFIMGNRSLSFWLVALSAHASDMSAWLFMAFPMTILVLGLPHVWIAVGLLGGMFLNWQFVAPKLRSMTEKYDCYTLSSFFEKRFHDHSGSIRLLSAVIMVIFLTHYLSAGLIAMGYLLESLFNLNYFFGLSLAMLVVVIYTFVGGYTTVAWTDLFQGIFLLLMIILVPFMAFSKIDGWHSIIEIAQQKNIPLTFAGDNTFDSWVKILSLSLGWGLGYFGMPHIITKFMGIRDVKEMHKSKWLGMSWQVVALGAAAVVGLIGIAYFPNGLEKPEMVFVEMVKDLFNPFVAGFILCSVIAANMSTMDSQILVCGSILSEDLYKHFHKTPPSDRKLLWFSKLSVVAVAVFALLLAFNKSSTILDTVLYSWSGLGSAFGPMVLMSLYSEKTNRYGAIAGMIVGTCVVMIWPTLNPLLTQYELLPMIPGFILSALAIYLVSMWTKTTPSLDNNIPSTL